jgi:hypothetical protein
MGGRRRAELVLAEHGHATWREQSSTQSLGQSSRGTPTTGGDELAAARADRPTRCPARGRPELG